MRRTPTLIGAPFPRLGTAGRAAALPVARAIGRLGGFVPPGGADEARVLADVRERLTRGERVLLVGVTAATHASGVAVVEADRDSVRLLANHEEERFTAEKHFAGFPARSIEAARETVRRNGGTVRALAAAWDYPGLAASLAGWALAELPGSLGVLRGGVGAMPTPRPQALLNLSRRLSIAFDLPRETPLLSFRHHDNHAWGALTLSPFGRSPEPVLVSVIDGTGDDGPLSLYLASGSSLSRIAHNPGICDSLGAVYALLSSTQGGWPPLSSEGRYMGAAAYGDGDRLTNPYYRELRQILHFGPGGTLALNRRMVRFFSAGRPSLYGPALTTLLGPPIPAERMWNPDAILRVEDVAHAAITRERVDKAAACQLVFEDALFHVIGHALRTTGAARLVLAGGTALNCVANLHLLERFDVAWYARNLGRSDTLRVWVPPVPGDAGVAPGAAIQAARRAGAPAGPPMAHAFWCGFPASGVEIRAAIGGRPSTALGPDPRTIARFMAEKVGGGAVIGLFQGAAETGPRALGHRSILADPTNPHVRELLNARVKHREAIRPLAPMATLRAAQELFVLPEGASDDEWNALRYMVLLVRARPEAKRRIPAVVHVDGTARVQIVRAETDPLTHAYLEEMGRRVGVEVSVNTSLNVGAPIAQTVEQAVATLERSKGMDGLVMVGADGEASWVGR